MGSEHPIPSPNRILLAPDSFKETLRNFEVVEAMAAACEKLWPGSAIDPCPMADGGEGSLEALKAAWGLSWRSTRVTAPIPGQSDIEAQWALGVPQDGRAVVELASSTGLSLISPADRDPELTSTHGVGMLMAEAARHNVQELVLCVGGSCTVDGGVGALAALGVVFRDSMGRALPMPVSGGALRRIAAFEVPEELARQWKEIRLRIAVDVRNPLLGASGAAHVFAPQKGADPQAVQRLEQGLANWARLLGNDPAQPGSGASGGVPYGLAAVLGGSIESGIEMILEANRFDQRCGNAELVLTGEGSLDAQSRMGKVPVEVAARARQLHVPVFAVVGRRGKDFGEEMPFHKIISLTEHLGEEEAMENPAAAIEASMEAALG